MSDSIPFSSIVEGSRYRNAKKYGDLSGMIDSIKSVGLIQPIVLSRNGDQVLLVAGGRRYRCMKEMGVKELHHGSTMNPDRLGFVWEYEVPSHKRLEAELDENLHRLDMDWIDSVLLVADVHKAKKDVDSTWGQRQTAALLGSGYGLTKVTNSLKIAEALRKGGDKELESCPGMSQAVALLLKRKEDSALAILQQKATEKASRVSLTPTKAPTINVSASVPTKALDAFADFPDLEALVEDKPDGVVPVGSVVSKVVPAAASITVSNGPTPAKAPPVEVPLSSMFLNADAIGTDTSAGFLSTLPDASFNHIVTDIPYGIDMENLTDSAEQMKDTHDVDQNVSMMLPFLTQAHRLIRPGGFCVFFYDLVHHEKLQAWALEAGFKVQRWPFIACKTSTCRNNAPGFNTTKNYEVAMFLRHDETSVLRKPITSSWNTYDFYAERKLYSNPFAKPFALWKDLYDAIAFPGQSVLDPYAGEMSACRAAANCGLVPYGIEINTARFNRGIELMKSVYGVIHRNNVSFV